MIRLTGVNTLVFYDELNTSTKQQREYFSLLANMGVPFVEVRREFIRDFDKELELTNKEASKLGLALLYSVPSSLFINEAVNPELAIYFKEAKKLGAIQIKLTIGKTNGFTPEAVSELKAIMQNYPDIRISIENDQSIEKGSIAALENFMEDALHNNLKLGLTFDTGNFVYIDEDPLAAANALRKYVNYVHIKNVKRAADNSVEMTLFQNGDLSIKEILDVLDKEERIIAALEYPCGNKEDAAVILKTQYKIATR